MAKNDQKMKKMLKELDALAALSVLRRVVCGVRPDLALPRPRRAAARVMHASPGPLQSTGWFLFAMYAWPEHT